MKGLQVVIAGALLVFGCSIVNAKCIEFVDIDACKTKLSSNGQSSLGGTFDITAAGIEGDSYTFEFPNYALPRLPYTICDKGGFVPGGPTIQEAWVTIWVRDDRLHDGKEKFDCKIEDMDYGNHGIFIVKILPLEVEAELLCELNATGQLHWTVTATRGDFYLDYCALKVKAIPLPASVWAGMLMLGSLGIVRKLRNR